MQALQNTHMRRFAMLACCNFKITCQEYISIVFDNKVFLHKLNVCHFQMLKEIGTAVKPKKTKSFKSEIVDVLLISD